MSAVKKSLILLSFLFLIWILGFAAYALASFAAHPDNDSEAEAIVILTGGDKRIEAGLSLLAQGKAPYVFISGVYADVREGEIRAMWKEEPPLPACCIVLGREAKTTAQNAQEVRAWLEEMKFKRIHLVTANYHMLRAEMELSHAVPELEIIPHPVVQPDLQTFSQRYWILLLSEYNKIIFRWLSFPFEGR